MIADHDGFDAPACAEVGAPFGQRGRRFRQGEGGHGKAELGHDESAQFEKTKMPGDEQTASAAITGPLQVLEALPETEHVDHLRGRARGEAAVGGKIFRLIHEEAAGGGKAGLGRIEHGKIVAHGAHSGGMGQGVKKSERPRNEPRAAASEESPTEKNPFESAFAVEKPVESVIAIIVVGAAGEKGRQQNQTGDNCCHDAEVHDQTEILQGRLSGQGGRTEADAGTDAGEQDGGSEMIVGLYQVAALVFQRHEDVQAVVDDESDQQGQADEREWAEGSAGQPQQPEKEGGGENDGEQVERDHAEGSLGQGAEQNDGRKHGDAEPVKVVLREGGDFLGERDPADRQDFSVSDVPTIFRHRGGGRGGDADDGVGPVSILSGSGAE